MENNTSACDHEQLLPGAGQNDSRMISTILAMLITFIGTVLGFTAFAIFLFCFGCKDASIWAFISGVVSAMNFQLHYLRWREKLFLWHTVESLSSLKSFGFFTFVISAAFMVYYIFYFVYYHLDFYPISESKQIAAIWAFMTAKYSGSLTYVCSRYSNTPSSYTPL